MPRTSPPPKAETVNFRIDPALKAAFTAAAAAEHKPAAQVLRDFMRVYVRRKQRRIFEADARHQSIAIAERSGDPERDDFASLKELDALFDEDPFGDAQIA
jgi:hypothetical protein